jgi:hypothetical protein
VDVLEVFISSLEQHFQLTVSSITVSLIREGEVEVYSMRKKLMEKKNCILRCKFIEPVGNIFSLSLYPSSANLILSFTVATASLICKMNNGLKT